MTLKVRFTNKAKKRLKKIRNSDRHLFNAMTDAIANLAEDPSIGIPKSGDLKGYSGLDVYHRGINFEIAYTVEFDEETDELVIILLGPRENFYKDLKIHLGL